MFYRNEPEATETLWVINLRTQKGAAEPPNRPIALDGEIR